MSIYHLLNPNFPILKKERKKQLMIYFLSIFFWPTPFTGFQFYTIDKRHNGHQSKYLFLANKYCIACRATIYNCHLLQKLLRAYVVPREESTSPQQRYTLHEFGVLVTHYRNHFVVRCHVHFQPRKLQ